MAEIDYYRLLGVTRDAELAAIVGAIGESRRKWTPRMTHPNLLLRQEAEQQMQLLSQMEKIFADPTSREAYDRSLATPEPAEAAAEGTAEDFGHNPWSAPGSGSSTGQTYSKASALPTWAVPATDWVRKHPVAAGGAALGVVVLIAVAASIPSTSPAPADQNPPAAQVDTSAPTDQSAPSTQPSAQPVDTPTPTTLAIGGDSGSSGFTVQNGQLADNNGPIILPATSSPISTDSLFPNEQVQSSSFTTVGTGTQKVYVGIVEVFHPAVDLTPEFYERRFVNLGADGSQVTSSTVLGKSSDENSAQPGDVWGTSAGLLIAGYTTTDSQGNSTDHTEALDTNGTVKWNSPVKVQSVVHDVPLVERSYSANDSNGNSQSCQDAEGLDPQTGSAIWSIKGTDFMSNGDCSASIETQNPLSNGDNSVLSQAYAAIDFNDGGSANGAVVDPTTGKRMKWRPGDPVTAGLVDPVTGDVFSDSGQDSNGNNEGAELYDPRTGKVLWTMSYAKASALSLSGKYIYGGNLYATTTSQNIVLDTSTGNVGGDWSDNSGDGVPVTTIDGYTLSSTGVLTPAG